MLNDGNVWQKSNTKVHLPLQFDISCTNITHLYRLSLCALHYGLQLESGHYSAVVFKAKGDEVYEISDTNTKNISFSWKDVVASHVYLAFYSLDEKRNRNKIDDSKSPCCPKRDSSDCIQVSDDDSLE